MTVDKAASKSSLGAEHDHTFGFLTKLRRLIQVYSASWSEHVSATVTPPQFGVLTQLQRQPEQDQKTLASTLSMDKSTAADVIRRLAAREQIEIRRDPNDSRRKILMPTAAGAACVEELTPRVDALRLEVFSALDAEQSTTFIVAIDALIAHLESDEQGS